MHATFQSIPIRAQMGDILRVVIKSSCLFQLQALGPCRSHLECTGGPAGRRGPSLLFLPFQQHRHVRNQCQHSVLKTGLLHFQNALQHNELLACLSSLKLFPEQRDSRSLQGWPHQLPPVPGRMDSSGCWARLTQLQWALPSSGGSFKRTTCVLILREFTTWNSILFLH